MSAARKPFLLSLVLSSLLAPAPVLAQPPSDPTVEVAARGLLELYADPSHEAAQALRRRVAAGAPPGALMAMLDAFRAQPRIEIADVVHELAGYRRTDVRARALAAWSALGGNQSERAIAAAADDLEPMIRRLAVALARRHPSPAAERTIAELLARDAELAAELAAPDDAGVPGGPS